MARRKQTDDQPETAVLAEETAVLPVVEEVDEPAETAVPSAEVSSTPLPHDALVRVSVLVDSLVVNHQRRLLGETLRLTYGDYLRLNATYPGALSAPKE